MSAGEGGAGVGRKGFRRVRKRVGGEGGCKSSRATWSEEPWSTALGKLFQTHPLLLEGKLRIPLSLVVEHYVKLENIFI